MGFDLSSSTALHCFPLDLPEDRINRLAGVLSPDELERASRFLFPRDRNRFIAGRGQVRCILGAILGRRPSGLRFLYGRQGKPRLPDDGALGSLQFNFSHSQAIGLLAVQYEDEVGVDLELVRPAFDALAVARRFFSIQEWDALCALPEPEQEIGFFRCWTRKEAIVKSCGRGISHPLDSFTVSCTATSEPESVVLGAGDSRVTRWLVPLPSPVPAGVAALATAGGPRPVRWVNGGDGIATGGAPLPFACHPWDED